ncbi:MAG: sensor domain-containing diguanylate cyclase [Azonexus sp.]|jgi:diguanylate cyclase (GGDEF)-like protein/PAS domain S-box-containing protein|nr:sensor domain-containing diguanylate cyclase [Azonexus sp.]
MNALETGKMMERIEPEDDLGVYKTLLESTKAIPWKINWKTKQFDYVGPQIEELLGWPQNSWLTAIDWIERIHAEDREETVNYCVGQSENGIDHEADYRALKADGGYVWIRDVVHVIRDSDGVTTDLVGFMFDISERKRMEELLLTLNKQLEALSCQDGLTGVANRHLLNRTMEAEWLRAQRSREPLSLVVFDIDHFKQYNDHYGHVGGDKCLVRVADAISRISLRSTDLFARYGGEEFVLVLPETSAEAAILVAEKCRKAVADLLITHEASETSCVLTISVGVSTLVPEADSAYTLLLESADRMLYQAKQTGRNRVCAC